MNINEYKYKYIYKKEASKQRAPAYLPLICYIVHSIPVCIYFVYVFVFVFHKVLFVRLTLLKSVGSSWQQPLFTKKIISIRFVFKNKTREVHTGTFMNIFFQT